MVRFKNRWLLVQLIPTSNIHCQGKHIWSAIKQSVLDNFGDTGWGFVGLSLTVKYYSPATNVCIVRVSRDHYRIAWASITLLTTIEGERCIPHVIHVSGTIKHAQIAAIEYNRTIVALYKNHAAAAESTREIEALQE